MKKVFIILLASSLGGITAKAQKQAKAPTPEISKVVLPVHDTRVADKNVQAEKPVLLIQGTQIQLISVPVQPTVQQAPVAPVPPVIIPQNPTPTELKVLAEQEKLKAEKK